MDIGILFATSTGDRTNIPKVMKTLSLSRISVAPIKFIFISIYLIGYNKQINSLM